MSKWNPKYNEIRNAHYRMVRRHFIKILGGKCIYCESEKKLELDHIVPNGFGAGRGQRNRMWDWFESYEKGNLQVLCSTCNNHKH